MTNIELIAKIKAEIERLKADYNARISSSLMSESLVSLGKVEVLNELLSFLSTLESEKPINPEVNFENEIEMFGTDERPTKDDLISFARRFYELGKQSGSLEKPINQDELEKEIRSYADYCEFDFKSWDYDTLDAIARHFAKWGAEHAREQMMKNALHGWLDEDNEPPYDLNVVCEEKIPFGEFKHCDRVRIIIVKED